MELQGWNPLAAGPYELGQGANPGRSLRGGVDRKFRVALFGLSVRSCVGLAYNSLPVWWV